MNALNLGTQPERRQLFSRDMLQEAAMNYGQCESDLRGAISCGLPATFTNQLSQNFIDAKANLEQAAMEYFDQCYDGAPE